MFPLYDNNPHRRVPWFTLLIIAVNVAVMFWEASLPQQALERVVAHYGFVPQRVEQLSDPNLVVNVQIRQQAAPQNAVQLKADPEQIYTSMFTMMFLHGGWWHLISNMWFLWIFGNNIEDRLGHWIFLCFYLLGGWVALACHYVSMPGDTTPVIGASGAVAAVLGAYAVTFPHAKVRTLVFVFLVDLPAMLLLALWFLQQLLEGLGMLGGGGRVVDVAWWAHIGGFIAGMFLMPILALGAPPPDQDWQAEAESQFG